MATKRLKVKAETALERRVLSWINDQAKEYDDSGAKGVLKDLFIGGCQSGIVGDLIYYSDTVKFYRQHQREIAGLLREAIENIGGGPEQVFGDKWEREDPLATETANQNLLAWFGFEETARRLADRAGLEI